MREDKNIDYVKVKKILDAIVVFCAIACFILFVISAYFQNDKPTIAHIFLALGFALIGIVIFIVVFIKVVNLIFKVKEVAEEIRAERDRLDAYKLTQQEKMEDLENAISKGEDEDKPNIRNIQVLNQRPEAHFTKAKTLLIKLGVPTIIYLLVVTIKTFSFSKVAGLVLIGVVMTAIGIFVRLCAFIKQKSISYENEYGRGETAEFRETSESVSSGELKKQYATVIKCFEAHESKSSKRRTKTNADNEDENKPCEVYRILFDVGGEVKSGFSRIFYNTGHSVRVMTRTGSKWAMVIHADKWLPDIQLEKANENDAEKYRDMQIISFAKLYIKYKDHYTSPANETLSKVKSRFEDPCTYHYFIKAEGITVGAMRIVDYKTGENKKLSQIMILHKYSRNGYATEAIKLAEAIHGETGWELETILQEKSLCSFYEKLGYKQTDRVRAINDEMTLVVYEK